MVQHGGGPAAGSDPDFDQVDPDAAHTAAAHVPRELAPGPQLPREALAIHPPARSGRGIAALAGRRSGGLDLHADEHGALERHEIDLDAPRAHAPAEHAQAGAGERALGEPLAEQAELVLVEGEPASRGAR